MSVEGLALAKRLRWVVEQTGETMRKVSIAAFGDSAQGKLSGAITKLEQDKMSRNNSDFAHKLADAAAKMGVPVRATWIATGKGPPLRSSVVQTIEYDDPYPNRAAALLAMGESVSPKVAAAVRSLAAKSLEDREISQWIEEIERIERTLAKVTAERATKTAEARAPNVSRNDLLERKKNMVARRR